MTDDKEARAREYLAKAYDAYKPGHAHDVRRGRNCEEPIKAMLAFAAEEVAAERERCAKIADGGRELHFGSPLDVAAMIRAPEAAKQKLESEMSKHAYVANPKNDFCEDCGNTFSHWSHYGYGYSQTIPQDGWIEWHGGENPLAHDPEARVVVKWRDAGSVNLAVDQARVRWSHTGRLDDILAYRIVSAKPKPEATPAPVCNVCKRAITSPAHECLPHTTPAPDPMNWRDVPVTAGLLCDLWYGEDAMPIALERLARARANGETGE